MKYFWVGGGVSFFCFGEEMDIDGVARLVENNHKESLRHFEHIKSMYKQQQDRCDARLCALEDSNALIDNRLDEHDKDFTKIRTIGGTLGAIWGGIVSLITIFR